MQRAGSNRSTTNDLAKIPFRFGEVRQSGNETATIVPRHSSENRDFLPVGYMGPGTIVADAAIALFDAPLWNMALIASRLHLVMDRNDLRETRNAISLLEHAGMEHLPRAGAHGEEQVGPDGLRRERPARARGALPSDHRGPLRSGQDAGEPPRRPRPKRRGAGNASTSAGGLGTTQSVWRSCSTCTGKGSHPRLQPDRRKRRDDRTQRDVVHLGVLRRYGPSQPDRTNSACGPCRSAPGRSGASSTC